jgi:hypothetical protein
MSQCAKCENRVVDEQKKPFGDYFFCRCSAHRTVPQEFIEDTELRHWDDRMCVDCAKETDRCRTCGQDLLPHCCDCDARISSVTAHWCDFCDEPRCVKCADQGDYFRDAQLPSAGEKKKAELGFFLFGQKCSQHTIAIALGRQVAQFACWQRRKHGGL